MHQRTQVAAIVALILVSSSSVQAAGNTLRLNPDWGLLGALIVGFVLFVFPLNSLLLKPLVKVLDEREARISGTRAKAARLSADAQAVLERYEAAIREAREEAERVRRAKLEEARDTMLSTTGTARSAAEAQLERARAELASTLDGARETLRGQASELAKDAAAQVLGRPLQ